MDYLCAIYGDYIDGDRAIVGEGDGDLDVIQTFNSDINMPRLVIFDINCCEKV